MNKKIVFCGGGNMAAGIIGGLISNKTVRPDCITVNELFSQRCEYLNKTYGVTAVVDAAEAIKVADMVIIAVNPVQVPSVIKTIKPLISKKTILLSIAAGVKIETIENQVGSDKKVVRIMPNTLIQSGNGHSAACVNRNIDENDNEFITAVLNSLGQIMYIREDMFGAFTAFSCSGPMWLYKTVEALIDAGVYAGFNRAEARDVVIKNMIGVAQVLDMTGDPPTEKVNEMCSPGGVTIEGFKVLQQEGFSASLMSSVDAAVKKANSIK